MPQCPAGHQHSVPAASWTIPPQARRVGEVRESAIDFVRAYGIREPQLSDVRLALSEAISNAVMHAFRDGREPGTVTVAVSISNTEGHLEIVVSDDGVGLTPRPDSPGLGLGLPIIRRLADNVDHHEPPGGGTELRILFGLPTDSDSRTGA
jgi:serine/threonine-protein kinase RsbW/stage II sporulation protein AB (anti-sigma F factor)